MHLQGLRNDLNHPDKTVIKQQPAFVRTLLLAPSNPT